MSAPDGLGAVGVALWDSVVGGLPEGWELDEREAALLALAAKQADTVAALEAVIDEQGLMAAGSKGQAVVNPAAIEARQGRLAVDRLLGKLALPAAEREGSETTASERGRQAANARWSLDARRKAREHG